MTISALLNPPSSLSLARMVRRRHFVALKAARAVDADAVPPNAVDRAYDAWRKADVDACLEEKRVDMVWALYEMSETALPPSEAVRRRAEVLRERANELLRKAIGLVQIPVCEPAMAA